jgi:hypothetical protein
MDRIPKPLTKEWIDEPVCPFVKENPNIRGEALCNNPHAKPGCTRCPPVYVVRSYALCPLYREV